MVNDIADPALAWLLQKLPSAMEALGIRAAGVASNLIDTPYPPASKPGNPPHRRTGNLEAGIEHAESPDGLEMTLTSKRVGGDPRVPMYLEYGTSKMAPRPYMRVVANMAPQMVPLSMKRSLSAEATAHESGD
jgi:hypothetical protein